MNLCLKYLQALEFLAELRNADWKFFQKKKKKGWGGLAVSSAKDPTNQAVRNSCKFSPGAYQKKLLVK